MKQLIVFPTPEDATVTLRHDSGAAFTGIAGFVADRPASILTLSDDLPNGNGAALRVEREGFSPLDQHGVLWLDRINPATGSVSFDVDTITLPKAQGSRPFAAARSGL